MVDVIESGLPAQVPVVVMNLHYSGLAVARDLKALGVRVIGISAEPNLPGNFSHSLEFRRAPDSLSEPEELAGFLVRLAAELYERPLLFPTRDHDLHFINRWRSTLEQAYRIPFAAPEVIDQAMNKEHCFDIARRCGIAVPATQLLRRLDDLEPVRSMRFPCIVKPLYASQWRQPGIWQAVGCRKAVKVDDFDQLRSLYNAFAHIDPLAMVQQWIPGPEESLLVFGSYCGRDHRVHAGFTARKRLQYPPLAGTGIVVEALPIDDIVAPSKAFLAALQFHGISEIEYKRDARDGSLYLIEINPRHWDQHGLGTAVGVNLSEAAYRDTLGLPLRAMQQSFEYVRWIAEPDFAIALLRSALRDRKELRQLLVMAAGPRSLAVHTSNDLGPTFAAIRAMAKVLWSSLAERLKLAGRQRPK